MAFWLEGRLLPGLFKLSRDSTALVPKCLRVP